MSIEDVKLGLAAAKGVLGETKAPSMLESLRTPAGSVIPSLLKAAEVSIGKVVGVVSKSLDTTGEFQIVSGSNHTAANEAQQIVQVTATEQGQEPHQLIQQALGDLAFMADRAVVAQKMYELAHDNLTRVANHLAAAQEILTSTVTFTETADQALDNSVKAGTRATANLNDYEIWLG